MLDSSQLYDLSLAIGQSTDLHANCDHFLTALMTVKQLDFCSVWLKYRLLMDADVTFGEKVEESIVLAYATPKSRFETESIPPDHPVFGWLAEKDPCSFAPPDDRFFGVNVEKRFTKGAVRTHHSAVPLLQRPAAC